MDAERAYDFQGTHLPIYRGFLGQATRELLARRQRVAAYGPGLALAQPLKVPYLDEAGEHLLDVEIGVSQGQPACLGVVSAHGVPLTGKILRELPLGRIVADAATRNSYRVFRKKRGGYIGVHVSDAFQGMLGFQDDRHALEGEVRDALRRRRAIDNEFLTQVAEIYRDAAARGEPTAEALKERFGPTTLENARRWISIARRRGFLGEALNERGGRAGERQSRGGGNA
jgi:hypothetical protein